MLALNSLMITEDKNYEDKLKKLKAGFTAARSFLQDLDANESSALAQDWRYRLTLMAQTIICPQARKSWLLHMTVQERTLDGMMSLVEEFNSNQLNDQNPKYDLIEIGHNDMGLYFAKKTYSTSEKFDLPMPFKLTVIDNIHTH
jgi:hypothetical protein